MVVGGVVGVLGEGGVVLLSGVGKVFTVFLDVVFRECLWIFSRIRMIWCVRCRLVM